MGIAHIPPLQQLLPFLQTYGYPVIFLAMFFEGPIITFVAAFASSIGYFNPVYIFLLSVAGNFLPDIFYYTIGYATKRTVLYDKLSKKGFSSRKIVSFKNKFSIHAGKMMTFIKIVPTLPPVGLVVAGMVLPFKKFISLSILISAVYSLFFFILGFYSGKAYNFILGYFKTGEIVLSLFFILVIIVWFIIKYIIKKELKDI